VTLNDEIGKAVKGCVYRSVEHAPESGDLSLDPPANSGSPFLA